MKPKFLFGETWFFEGYMPGEPRNILLGLAVKKKILESKSTYQHIEIFDTAGFGRVLFLDGFIQLSTKHEFVYHEMLVHPAMFAHQNPKSALIIGGGDGGVLREVAKHKVEEIFLVDIDKKVTDVSKKYLPSVSLGAFGDKRLRIFHEDALGFVKRYKNHFDVIIDDLTDPTGKVSSALWKTAFYRDILKALKENGVASFQTAYLKEKFAKKTRENLKKVFPYYTLHKAYVGCFPLDEHTFSSCSKKINFDAISIKDISRRYKKSRIKTKYYSPAIHFASSVLPQPLN